MNNLQQETEQGQQQGQQQQEATQQEPGTLVPCEEWTARPQSFIVNLIIAYEDGELNLVETVWFFAALRQSGLLNVLQGTYHRTFWALVDSGYLTPHGDVLRTEEDNE